jgi:uncharacterized protein YjbJ (UPF0337 family)
MDKEHIKGTAKKAEGSVKETAGKMAGDKSLELKGKADKAEGNIRNAVGDVKDAFKKK